MGITVRSASAADVQVMAQLLAVKRTQLESFEPVMWRPSEAAAQLTPAFFAHQLGQPNVIARVAENGGQMLGFAIGVIQDAPPVFSPGGKSVLIDDFAVSEGPQADAAASGLLDAVISEARARGAVQIIAIAAARDARAVRWLESKKLHVASQWWTRTLTH
jgi:GNAT superfamily N-acetyltransferase